MFLAEANLISLDLYKSTLDSVWNKFHHQNKPEIRKWFETQYARWLMSPENDEVKPITRYTPTQDDPMWAQGKTDLYIFDPAKFLDSNHMAQVSHMIDYFNSLEPSELKNIWKEPYSVITSKVNEWNAMMAKRATQAKLTTKESHDYVIVYKYPDGYFWARLTSQRAYQEEGDLMGHCVGDYDVNDRSIIILSLRDPRGYPHATIETTLEDGLEVVVQIKGKGNKAPVEKYRQKIRQFLAHRLHSLDDIHYDYKNAGFAKFLGAIYDPDSPQWKRTEAEMLPLLEEKTEEMLKPLPGTNPPTIERFYYDEFASLVTSLPEIPKHFKIISANLSRTRIRSLRGLPDQVDMLTIDGVKDLKTLEECPMVIKLDAPNSGLESLKGLRTAFDNSVFINVSGSELTSLEGLPKYFKGSINISRTPIKSLAGAPYKMTGCLLCYDTNCKDLYNIPLFFRREPGDSLLALSMAKSPTRMITTSEGLIDVYRSVTELDVYEVMTELQRIIFERSPKNMIPKSEFPKIIEYWKQRRANELGLRQDSTIHHYGQDLRDVLMETRL